MVYKCKEKVHSLYDFRTMDQDGVKQRVAHLLDRDLFTCPEQTRTDCKYRFVATEIVDLLYETYFAGVRQLGMKDRRMIDMINSTFIVLAATAIHRMKNWRMQVVFYRLKAKFLSTSPEVQTNTIEEVKMMIRRRQRWTGVVEVNASMPYNDNGVYQEEYLSYVPEELADVSDNSFRRMTAKVEAAQSALLLSHVRHDIISSTVDVSGTSNTNTNNINDN
ncbi:hypothetical protein K440DRAFT_643723 [Wilcoxina mikolae CBS 423.85]|nr:hypothetical protein K440DRAFT_643723 [Wilcoxina mikolae CBS 423.85]